MKLIEITAYDMEFESTEVETLAEALEWLKRTPHDYGYTVYEVTYEKRVERKLFRKACKWVEVDRKPVKA